MSVTAPENVKQSGHRVRQPDVASEWKSNPPMAPNAGQFLACLFLLVTIICALVPFSPNFPAGDLDTSWQLGMNQALAQGLKFGEDVIFTFGPFAAIYTRSYHPATDGLMIWGSLFLAISYWGCLIYTMRRSSIAWVLVFCIVFAAATHPSPTIGSAMRNAVLFSIPLVSGMAIFRLSELDHKPGERPWLLPLIVVLSMSPLGLLPLIKGSLIFMCGAIVLLATLLLLICKERILAALVLMIPMVSMVLFWILVGQPISSLPNYFVGMRQIVAGYSGAMALDGPFSEVAAYLFAAVASLCSLAFQRGIAVRGKLFLLGSFIVFLFLAFKGGFVRHDSHALIAGTAVLMGATLMPLLYRSRFHFVALFAALVAWFHIDQNYVGSGQSNAINRIAGPYSSAISGMHKRLVREQWAAKEFEAAMDSLRTQRPIPSMPGTSDIYSFNQSYLIASGNSWSPRPVLQSYSTYTADLAEANRQHLLGARAPDNLIFSLQPIDRRLPSLDDGPSWPVMLSHYQFSAKGPGFLHLTRRDPPLDDQAQYSEKARKAHSFGEWVKLPESSQALMATIEVIPTPRGQLTALAYKQRQLQITLRLKSGLERRYRLIASMARSEFMISPLIENTGEFAMLYKDTFLLGGKQVDSFKITPLSVHGRNWKQRYTVKVRELQSVSISGTASQDLSDLPVKADCLGQIEEINCQSPVPKQIFATSNLDTRGWIAVCAEQGILPNEAHIVLIGNDGNNTLIPTRRTSRPDIAESFAQPGLQ